MLLLDFHYGPAEPAAPHLVTFVLNPEEWEEKQFFTAAVGTGVRRNRGRGAALLGQKDARLAD